MGAKRQTYMHTNKYTHLSDANSLDKNLSLPLNYNLYEGDMLTFNSKGYTIPSNLQDLTAHSTV